MPRESRYATDAAWADVEPLPQDDGGPNALATIAYNDEYREATGYLRAAMAANELSERVLELTQHVISMNPAHYTVWLYRAKALRALDADLHAELAYLNELSLRHIKNYQIWHHRQFLVARIGASAGESAFLARMLDKDAKNYHVWSYRQWLVAHFALWADPGEWAECERWLERDVRNNSAWNFRWFLAFGQHGHGGGGGGGIDEETVLREEQFAMQAIALAPQNESPWSYLRGLYKETGRPLALLEDFARRFASLEDGGSVLSSHALDLLADIYAEDEGKRGDAERALELLAQMYDPIRANYWNYRKSLLGAPNQGSAAG